jgi:hypothetical protein
LTLALVGGEWSASRPGRFTPGERAPGPQWTGGWVDPRASEVDTCSVKKQDKQQKVYADGKYNLLIVNS